MPKPPPRRHLMKLDRETQFLHDGLKMLSQLDVPARQRLLDYWSSRIRSLPLCDTYGSVIDEHPVDDPPPTIHFIHERREEERAKTPEAAGQ